jgi:hypothetical protein
MPSKISSGALLVAAAALALPLTSAANGTGDTKRCERTPMVGYSVSGTLVSAVADDPATTEVFEGSVTITVTEANGHARKSGEIADMDPATDGVQVAGATYTVSGDAFKVRLNDYDELDTPSPGDSVKIIGRIPRTRAKCAPEGTTLADRYGAPDVRKVTVTDADPDV